MTVEHSEVLRLRATIGDLLALSTIPEAWVGKEPPAIAAELADVLIGSLRLDFAFVRLRDPIGREAVEVMRGDSWKAFPEWLQQRLAGSGQISRKEIVTKVNGVDESSRGILIPIGVNGERGLVAAACARSDFPGQLDQQLLSVAANNGATAFRNARLINELRRVEEALRDNEQELRQARDVLEIKVAERTSELQRAFEEIKSLKERLQHENIALREEVDEASMFEEIVGDSAPLRSVLAGLSKVAPTDSTVLIIGETGTGKELLARAIHKRSQRSARAFVSVNCAAIPHELIASELFGHERGAFTGATQRRLGRFELAEGGTIFLDEAGELQPDTQVALLRVLQEREIERVGGGRPVHVDVRVIAATNRDLKAAAANGSFRQDLFYRLNVFPIQVPPLRERKDDILMLVEYFVQRYASRAGKNIRSIDKKTLGMLQAYDWPGNIRELQNVVERFVILCSGDVFAVDELWLSKELSQPAPRAEPSAQLQGEQRSEREIIETALAESRGRVSGPSGAAAKLQIPPSTLEYKIKNLKIRKNQFRFR